VSETDPRLWQGESGGETLTIRGWERTRLLVKIEVCRAGDQIDICVWEWVPWLLHTSEKAETG
jgi:hypothetical protein